MSRVSGMGCTATAITGAFLAADQDPLVDCVNAATLVGIEGAIAAQKCEGPGSFRSGFCDIVHAALKGGVTIVQPREKEASAREMVALGKKLLCIISI